MFNVCSKENKVQKLHQIRGRLKAFRFNSSLTGKGVTESNKKRFRATLARCGIILREWRILYAMPVYKDKERGTWYCSFYYTDWQGSRRLKKKRGFKTKREALAWEDDFLHKMTRSCDMTFASMVEIYMADMETRLRANTMNTKRYLVELRILPFFGKLKLNEITPAHVRKWQSEILAENVAPTYAKTINNQLSAILNYAVKYYGLQSNPARSAGSMGKKDAEEMKFWTVDQFNEFIRCVPKMPARVGLSIMFWTGIRIGELLALSPSDIDLEAKTLTVKKSFQMIDGKEVITEPKTPRSRRVIPLPNKLCNEIRAYENALYEPDQNDRLFPYTKHYFSKQLAKGCEESGIERIRIHDLRHSHASLLIHLGFPILLVSERLGHEDVQTTLKTYGHLYPSVNSDAVTVLDKLMLDVESMEQKDYENNVFPNL